MTSGLETTAIAISAIVRSTQTIPPNLVRASEGLFPDLSFEQLTLVQQAVNFLTSKRTSVGWQSTRDTEVASAALADVAAKVKQGGGFAGLLVIFAVTK